MNSPNRKTVSAISRDWSRALRASQKPPVWDLGNLLDDFRCHCMTPEEKLALVSDPPEPTGEPETDAYLARYLVAEAPDFLNGSCLGLDGGIAGRLHDPV